MKNKNPLHDHFEKLYFHEVESREKLNGRLQLPLGIIMAILGAIAYIAQKLQLDTISDWDIPFTVSLAATVTFLGFAVIYFRKSWLNNVYSFLPTPNASIEYRKELETTYSKYKKKDKLVDKYMNQYIFNGYAKYTSENAECNDKRSINLNKSHEFLIYSGIALLLTFILFLISNFDKKNNISVRSTSPTTPILRRINVTKKQTTASKLPQKHRAPRQSACCRAYKSASTAPAPPSAPPSAPSDPGRR